MKLNDINGERRSFDLPENARRFIERFDFDEFSVRPFSFVLEID